MLNLKNENGLKFQNNDKSIHIPRVYLNNIDQIREILLVLENQDYLNNKEMTFETQRIRSEHARELLIILWRLQFGIDVVRENRSYAFSKTSELTTLLNLDENNFLEIILEKLKKYVPYSSVLYKIKKFNESNIQIDEHLIKVYFHPVEKKGNSDNIHPLLRWAKGFNHCDENYILTKEGINFLDDCISLDYIYLNYNVDINYNKDLYKILEYYHLIDCDKFPNEESLINLNKVFKFKDTLILENYFVELKELGFPIQIDKEFICVSNPIYFDITPKDYINANLNKNFRSKKITKNSTNEELNISNYKEKIIIINDEKTTKIYGIEDYTILSYKELALIREDIPKLGIKLIILDQGWKPLKNISFSGLFLSFIKNGGKILIIKGAVGRLGANMNMFCWLPYEISKINYLENNNIGSFKFTFGENFNVCNKEYYQENNSGYEKLSIKYFKGSYIFYTNYNLSFIKNLELQPVYINPKDISWEVNYIPELIHSDKVNRERDLYPIIRNIFDKYLNIKTDPDVHGHSGETDIASLHPFKCLFEVNVLKDIVCGASKISEVFRHRKKYSRRINNYIGEKIGACVIGYTFSNDSGDERDGSVETAEDLNVNLMSYFDIYEIVCMNKKLNKDDLKDIIYNFEENLSEISLKIIPYLKKYE